MYHGLFLNHNLIALVFAGIVWLIRLLTRGIKQISKPTGGTQTTNPAQAPPRSQAPPRPQAPPPSRTTAFSQAPPPSGTPAPRPALTQTLPQRTARLAEPIRQAARQPSAGGPAVADETNRGDFERQERELMASEPSALNALSAAPAFVSAIPPNGLFSGTDDLVRAIILQEVLGPPLSRRGSNPSPPATQ